MTYRPDDDSRGFPEAVHTLGEGLPDRTWADGFLDGMCVAAVIAVVFFAIGAAVLR